MMKIMTKIVKAFTDIKVVGGVLASIIFALSAYANSHFVRIDGIQGILNLHEIKEIRRNISMLEVDKNDSKTASDRKKYSLKIKIAENQIKEIKGE